jgi:ABC-2 type transport system ATP-binding protein
MITASGITKSYGAVSVLDGVDLEVPYGTVLALLGSNGAGKTTMVRILSTLVPMDAGSATVAGHDVATSPVDVRRAISLTGQNTAVDELLTGEENLLLMSKLRRLSRSEARQRTSELLAEFDLADAAGRLAKTYSGGMKRRLDIAISLITRPPVIFLDEPTTGLDPRSRQTMWDVVRKLVANGTTILLTTQYLEEADQLADSIAVLHGGKIVSAGTAAELKRRVEVERIELTFADVASFARGAGLLAADGVAADQPRRMITVPSDGTAASVKQVLDRLDDHDVPVARVAVHEASLDDVFLSLTGR